MSKMLNRWSLLVASTTVVMQVANPVLAKSAEEKRDEKSADIPRCSKKIGTASIVEPENKWWREIEGGLGSPEALIRIYVRQSGCFTLVNRGRGFDVAMQERDLASSGQLRGGSNLGKGQIKTADYIIVPDIVTRNSNKGGTNVGGIIGGLFGGTAGAILGGISLKKSSANVILYVTDTRSSEEVAASEGRAEKRDLGWGAGGGLFTGGFLGAGGASGYANTEIGQVVALAYLDAYTKMVGELGGLPDSASAANAVQAVSLKKPGKLYASSSIKSKVIVPLDVGQLLYPTGNKTDQFWEVEDELGNKGWISMALIELAK